MTEEKPFRRCVVTPELRANVLSAPNLTQHQAGELFGVSATTIARIRNEAGVDSLRVEAIRVHAEARSAVLNALSGGRLATTGELADELGETKDKMSTLLNYLEEKGHVEKSGLARTKHHIRPLWRAVPAGEVAVRTKLRTALAVTEKLNPIIPPPPVYASEFARFLGEPPLDRSALAQRRRAAE